MKNNFYLIPIKRGTKIPATRNGEKDASNDPAQWQRWKHMYPGCNWAICTGPSGLIAIDEDCYKPAWKLSSVLQATGLEMLPRTVEWQSARGGRVRLYRTTVELISRNGILPAIDVKARTGFVLCPPSRNSEGQKYTWANPPSAMEVTEAPRELIQWLVDYVPPRAEMRNKIGSAGMERVYLKAGEGRWEFIRRLGGILRREGCGFETINKALQAFVKTQCEYDDSLRPAELDRLCHWLMTVPIGETARFEESLLQDADGKWYAVDKKDRNE